MLHRISSALDLGDIAFVTEQGARVDSSILPTVRQVAHGIDLARAHSYAAQDDEAIAELLAAEAKSPQLVRHNPAHSASPTIRPQLRFAKRSAVISHQLSSFHESTRHTPVNPLGRAILRR